VSLAWLGPTETVATHASDLEAHAEPQGSETGSMEALQNLEALAV